MSTLSNLRLAALNRHRVRLFGTSSLKAYTTTPELGEVLAAEFLIDWSGQRTQPITGDQQVRADSGMWQFQIAAPADWTVSQAFMNSVVVLTVGTRRWKVKKVEKPIGESLVWKVRAEIQ